MKILQIGYGRAGKHIASLFKSKGFECDILVRKKNESILNEDYNFITNLDVDLKYDVLVLATPDNQIERISKLLSNKIKVRYVIHLSGATSLNVLSSFQKKDDSVTLISLHPNIAFEDNVYDKYWYEKVYFGLTTDYKGINFVVGELDLPKKHIIMLEDKDKSKYHAAAVIASNLIMPILQSAVDVYESIGIDNDLARILTSSLSSRASENLKKGNVKKIITGPIARSDFKTIENHLSNLSGKDREMYLKTSSWLKEIVDK